MKPILLTTLFLLSLYLHAAGQKSHGFDTTYVDSYVTHQMDKWHIPGCAIAVVRGNSVMYAKGYGFRSVEEKLQVTPHTIFNIASCTKSFTAAAANLLVTEKLLNLDKPVTLYLPQLQFINRDLTEQVTLRDLLSHQTGLYDDDWSWVGDHIDEARMFEIISATPQLSPFRASYSYSNLNYALVGKLIAKVSGSSWRNYLRKTFFAPLRLQNTTFSHNENSGVRDFAYGYTYSADNDGYVRTDLSEHLTDSLSMCEAFGFISSSVMDLSKWVQLFINGGKYQLRTILPADVLKQLIRPANFMMRSPHEELSDLYYGMGWYQSKYKGHALVQHSGGMNGFKSYMSFMPTDSIGVVVLTNGQAYEFPQAISFDLYDAVLGASASRWSEKYYSQKLNQSDSTRALSVKAEDSTPLLPLTAYAGTYWSQWLGKIKVSCNQGNLYFYFHHYPPVKMIHSLDHTFSVEDYEVSFHLSNGRLTGMTVNDYSFDKLEK